MLRKHDRPRLPQFHTRSPTLGLKANQTRIACVGRSRRLRTVNLVTLGPIVEHEIGYGAAVGILLQEKGGV